MANRLSRAEIDLLDEMMPLGANQIARLLIVRYKSAAQAVAEEYFKLSSDTDFASIVLDDVRLLISAKLH